MPVAPNGLLMGFKTVAIEKRSAEVWQTLGAVKEAISRQLRELSGLSPDELKRQRTEKFLNMGKNITAEF